MESAAPTVQAGNKTLKNSIRLTASPRPPGSSAARQLGWQSIVQAANR
jgi:hypothetical protein